MTPPLTIMQLWALWAGGPIAMILTVLVGILVNNAVTKANFAALRSEIGGLKSDIGRAEGSLRSNLQRVEGSLKSELAGVRSVVQRVEGVLAAKIDGLAVLGKALEDEIRSPLVKR